MKMRFSTWILALFPLVAGCQGLGINPAPFPPQNFSGPMVTPTPCVQKFLCEKGNHWDSSLCSCVPDSTFTPPPTPATTFCVEKVLCVKGTHWDPNQCTCVDDETVTPTPAATFCVQNMLCIQGKHWDSGLCTCVADTTATPTPLP